MKTILKVLSFIIILFLVGCSPKLRHSQLHEERTVTLFSGSEESEKSKINDTLRQTIIVTDTIYSTTEVFYFDCEGRLTSYTKNTVEGRKRAQTTTENRHYSTTEKNSRDSVQMTATAYSQKTDSETKPSSRGIPLWKIYLYLVLLGLFAIGVVFLKIFLKNKFKI